MNHKMRACGMVLAAGCAVLLTGCEDNAAPSRTANTQDVRASFQEPVEKDVEAPDVFQHVGLGIWDGRPSLGGVWVAHPLASRPERVLIRNSKTGKEIKGALFRRDGSLAGPSIQLSSDAAKSIGVKPGEPTELVIVALRREVVQPEPANVAENTEPTAGPDNDVATSPLPDEEATATEGSTVDADTAAPPPVTSDNEASEEDRRTALALITPVTTDPPDNPDDTSEEGLATPAPAEDGSDSTPPASALVEPDPDASTIPAPDAVSPDAVSPENDSPGTESPDAAESSLVTPAPAAAEVTEPLAPEDTPEPDLAAEPVRAAETDATNTEAESADAPAAADTAPIVTETPAQAEPPQENLGTLLGRIFGPRPAEEPTATVDVEPTPTEDPTATEVAVEEDANSTIETSAVPQPRPAPVEIALATPEPADDPNVADTAPIVEPTTPVVTPVAPPREPTVAEPETTPSVPVAATETPVPSTPGTPTPDANGPARPYVQVGLFGVKNNAERLRRQLELEGYTVRTRTSQINNKDFTRVMVGPAASLAELTVLLNAMRTRGFKDATPVRG